MKCKFMTSKTLLLSISFVSVLLSCSKESEFTDLQTTENIELSDEMIEKIAYGCTSYLDEVTTDEKIETSASDDYMALLEERMTKVGGNKYVEYVYNRDQQYVGVIEVDGCGKYEKYNEVIINYDSENKKNNNKRFGFNGAWSGSENITMRFCLVPYQSFGRTGEWYGVMNFSDLNKKNMLRTSSQGVLHVLMDAEDRHDDRTNMRFNNYALGAGSWPDSKIGNVKVDRNGNLEFQMIIFEPGNSSEPLYSYPDFGFDYGVFGTLKPYKVSDIGDEKIKEDYGMVYSDDEDSDNANWMKYNFNWYNENFHNIIVVNKNTTMYMSKIRTKNKNNR